jgi:hypothetical protein
MKSPNLPKEFNPILKNCAAELDSYTITQHSNTLMDILLHADPCISKFTLKIEIINNRIVVLHSPPPSSGLFKRRSDGIIILLEETLQKHVIADCVLYLHVKDSYINYDEPFFIYARPTNKKGLLYIDHSWIDAEPEKKITKEKGGAMININSIRVKSQRPTAPRNKKNSLFFIGQNVPLINSNDFFFRKYFAQLQWPFEVKTTGYLNMGEYSKWKYLLNLPGWYPWSFRFKFLFLMNSFIINVNLLRPEIDEGKWIQIADAMFIPGKDYIELDFKFDKNEINTLSQDIIEIFKRYNYSKQDFDKIVENGRKKGALLTYDNIVALNATVFNMYSTKVNNNKINFYDCKTKNNVIETDRSQVIFEYISKLTISSKDLIYSKNSKVFRLSEDYVIKCYPCSLDGYRELKTYEKLNNKCVGFPKLYDSFIDGNNLYIIIEPLDINLCEYFTSYKITKQSWKKIKDELVIIIKRLHGLNIYHNAIVPENIMYSYKTEQFYFIDFKQSSDKSTNDDIAQLDLLFNINLLQ